MTYRPKILDIPSGGFGLGTYTAYTPVCAGTTSTGAFQSLASLGNSGDVLTSNGASALPSFQAPTGGGLGYTFFVNNSGASNPSDGATYAMVSMSSITTQTYSGTATTSQRTYIPQAGTITKHVGIFLVASVLGSAQNVTLSLYVNDVSQATISTFTLDASAVSVTNASLNVSVSAGDYVSIIMSCPTWTTNPTSVTYTGTVYVT